MSSQYGDIINLPRHESATHSRMSKGNRAAQFSPFAALTGYNSAIKETARLTDMRIELGESEIEEVEMKLRIIADIIASHPKVSVTYFQPDERKNGGAYVTITDMVKNIDDVRRVIAFMEGKSIAIEDILDIECERFVDYLYL